MATDEKEEPLSPEEESVNSIFAEYDPKIEELQNRLNNFSPSKPQPVPRPSWARGLDNVKHAPTEAELKKSMSDLVMEAKGKAAKVFEKSQPGLQAKLYEKTDKWQNQDHKGRDEGKSLDQTQSYLERLKAGGKMVRDQQQIDKDTKQFGQDYAESKYNATNQHSNYYSRLDFNAIDNGNGSQPAKTDKSIEPDKV